MDIFDELVAEQERLEDILIGLDDNSWATPSAAVGWTVADVVLHLAQTEEAVVATATGQPSRVTFSGAASGLGSTLDEVVDRWVASEREAPSVTPSVVFDRWRIARRAAVAALRAADPAQPLQWAATPIKPRTLATTRLAEHWAHGLDITAPLGVPFPDTDRLRHVAWLAHSTLPYAFAFAGEEPAPVFCDLTGPVGSSWRYGPPDADSSISGSAGAFCRVGARRIRPEDSGLVARGPHGSTALRVLRNYVG
jgi:uncharacterized protein (TIGR03084 family)